MSRGNSHSKWQREVIPPPSSSKSSTSPNNYEEDDYRKPDLRARIEAGRKAKEQKYSSNHQLKSNVAAVTQNKYEEKYTSRRLNSWNNINQVITIKNPNIYLEHDYNHKHNHFDKSNTNNKSADNESKELNSSKKKHEVIDENESSKLRKKIRLEAETSEIISEGSNDEEYDNYALNEPYNERRLDKRVEKDLKIESEGEISDESNKKQQDQSESEREASKSYSDDDDDDEDESEDEKSDKKRKNNKANSESEEEILKNDREKSLENVSSDGTLDEKTRSQDTEPTRSDNDTDDDRNKHTDEEMKDEESVVDEDDHKKHKHKHSHHKHRSKRSSKKHSKKRHKHTSEEDFDDDDVDDDGDKVKQSPNNDLESNNDYDDNEHQIEEMHVEEVIKIETTTTNINPSSPAVEASPKLNDNESIIERFNCAIEGCRSVEEFECLNRIEEGTYGVVYRAKDKKTGELVALKRLKMEKEREGFPITSLREIDTLLKAQHRNIVTVREIVVGSNMDKIYLVMDYVEHDLKSLMQYSMKNPFMTSEVKTLMLQLLSGIAHLHDNWIIHRDLKTSNLLLSHKGVLKIADFGLAREYGSPLKEYTPIVVTLWYRSVELLLGVKKYSTAVDMWSVGAIFGELLLMKALFQGKNEKDQLDKIFKDLGTPNEKIWPGYKDLPLVKKLTFGDFPYNTLRSRFGSYLTDAGFALLNRFLTYDPAKRITADAALKHEFFNEKPAPKDPAHFPTWPAKSEGASKKQIHDNEPKAPEAGKMYEKLLHEEDGFALQMPITTTGFQLK